MPNEKWSLMRKINNFSLLRMISVGKDWHLRHCLYFLKDEEREKFDKFAKRYLKEELSRKEISLDHFLEDVAEIFLGESGRELMELHIRIQRALRDEKHRDHISHLLSTFLLAAYLIQIDLDVLTITRNISYFQKLLKEHGISPERYPREDTLQRYPPGEIFAKAFDPENKNEGKFFYADAFYFLFLFHDVGYLLELINDIQHPEAKKEVEEKILGKYRMKKYEETGELRRKTLEEIISFPFKRNQNNLDINDLIQKADDEFNQKRDHGVVSSLILYENFLGHLLDKKTKHEDVFCERSGEPKQKKDKKNFIYDCLGAICLHNLHFHKRISVQDSLYYFLLKFIDIICDWSRYFKGGKSYYPIQLIDEIILGYRPEYENSARINIVFDFSNLEALISKDVEINEIIDFKGKIEELNQLDYTIVVDQKGRDRKYQWFFFEMILIDRNGERHKIDNKNNKAKYSKIDCPLFTKKNIRST